MIRPAPPWTVGLLFFAGLPLACVPLGCGKAAQTGGETTPPAPVQAVNATKMPVGEWTEILGTTQPLPNHAARVTAAIEGRVMRILGEEKGPVLAEGQHVDAGQVIAQLDDQVVQANLKQLEATQKSLEQEKTQADYAVELATDEAKRLEKLSKDQAEGGTNVTLVSDVDLKKAQIALQDAQSKQQGAAHKLVAGQASITALNAQLKLYQLKAQISGWLGMVQVVPGQTLSVGTPVADIIDLDEIDAVCFVPPHVVSRLKLDQPARIRLEQNQAEGKFSKPTGHVVFIAQGAQETGNFPVKVRFPNHNPSLRANAVVTVEVLTEPEKDRLTIPDAALMEDQQPTMVLVVGDVQTQKKEDKTEEKVGKIQRLVPKIGVRDRQKHVVEILGLEDPDKKEKIPVTDQLFVVAGGQGLEDGDVVKLKEAEQDEGGKDDAAPVGS